VQQVHWVHQLNLDVQVGSIYEYIDKNPIFGIVTPDSPLYAPILGIFAFTGLPTSGYLFFKAIRQANETSRRMDNADK
jgi:vacuolar iron transporter family protein